MKEVYYSAEYHEIWIKHRDGVERGMQAKVSTPEFKSGVPDYLSLFRFKVDSKSCEYHLKKGWIVKLGVL